MRSGAHFGMKNAFLICETAKSFPNKKKKKPTTTKTQPQNNIQGPSCNHLVLKSYSKIQYSENGKNQKLHERVNIVNMVMI